MTDPIAGAPARRFALVPCAGLGLRAGTGGPKQYTLLQGRSLVAHTLSALAAVRGLEATLVVLAPQDAAFEAAAPDRDPSRVWVERCGGATRAATVAAGIEALRRRGAAPQDWVLVHDAARCLLRPAWVERLIEACGDDEVGGLLALPVADTLKRSQAQRVAATVSREGMWAAQTPQMFRLGLLQRALAAAGPGVTDEAGAVEALGLAPRLVAGDAENFKLTWPGDFALAERLLATRPAPTTDGDPRMSSLRIGEGWDVHQLVTGRPLVLGGVTIAHSHGLLGHSDADALAHAITDALFGAAALGDIGRHFSDTDPQFAGADSMLLLAEAARRVRAAGFRIVNVDSTIVAQAPKMAPHIPAMRERLAQALGLSAGQVNVKAKTAERLGPVGRGESIEARAVCLLDGSESRAG